MIPIKDNIPTDRFPLVTVVLILANVIVYLLSIRHGGSVISGPDPQEVVKYGATPYALTHSGVHCGLVGSTELGCGRGVSGLPAWETVFTAMFMHASILHIGGNMLFLWIFGNNVEDSMGRIRFLIFYLLGGVAALALQVAVGPNTVAPTLGASGAIAAVLGGYIVLHPRARVLTLVFIIFFFGVIELPALVMLGIWFAEQAVFGAAGLTSPGNAGGGVAYFAHVGGFVFGLLTIRLVATRRKPTPPTAAAYR
ncbi:MAG TPA: rhomboid family intramembrane serine protease [Solirubrobacteraceae bacterium]|jgi:membrane associated rhomboid family serine protease|nr:rhomboid family intramembrane serine protease [Solirubrobacteraceae bacterium]